MRMGKEEVPLKREDWLSLIAGLNVATGQRVRNLRERMGLTQKQVADQMSELLPTTWQYTTVTKVESGKRPLKLQEAWALAFVLGQLGADQVTGDLAELQRHTRANALQHNFDLMLGAAVEGARAGDRRMLEALSNLMDWTPDQHQVISRKLAEFSSDDGRS